MIAHMIRLYIAYSIFADEAILHKVMWTYEKVIVPITNIPF